MFKKEGEDVVRDVLEGQGQGVEVMRVGKEEVQKLGFQGEVVDEQGMVRVLPGVQGWAGEGGYSGDGFFAARLKVEAGN
jgi:16S rRNA C967 or C1407 C5-methylase (RsmB/RsmF family)